MVKHKDSVKHNSVKVCKSNSVIALTQNIGRRVIREKHS